jgi:hypothetical protein
VPVGTFATFSGMPNTFYNSAPHTFSIAPTLYFKRWLNEDVSITANVQYASATHLPINIYPGLTLSPVGPGSLLPASDPFSVPSRTTVDMHIDWRHVTGSRINLSVVSTNITNALYNISNSSGYEISGSFEAIYNEPRMVYVEINVPFGPGS